MKKIAAALLLSTAVAAPAFAADNGFYVLGAVGQTTNFSKTTTDSDLIALGVTGLVSSANSTDTAYKLQAGYQLNTNFAIEGGYVDLGKFTYNATATNVAGAIGITAEVSVWNLSAVGILPLGNQFSALGKLGVAEVRSSCSSTANVTTSCPSKTDLTYGLGVKYDLTSAVSLRGDWDSYKTSGDRLNVWTVGVGYKF